MTDASTSDPAERPQAAGGPSRRRERVALIGYGAIARDLTRLIEAGGAGPVQVVGVLVRDPARHRAAAEATGWPFVADTAALLAARPDVVIEIAGHEALRAHGAAIVGAGIDLLLVSVGALGDDRFRGALLAAAERGGGRLLIPSGAIAALDAISSAAVIGLDRVRHTVRKPPAALLDEDEARLVTGSGQARELYLGPAREAARLFPANVNVAAAVSLAGIGLDRTEVRVVADPAVVHNTHEVEAEGAFGRLFVRMENVPGENPKTGRIVAPSLARALRDRTASFVVGA